MEVVVAGDVPEKEGKGSIPSLRSGTSIRQGLLAVDEAEGLSFTVSRTQWLPGDKAARSPRHHHAFQQIRWAEQGTVNYGPGQNIAEGDVAYFPRGTYYGPQDREEGIVITVQFGFNGEKQHGTPFWKRYEAAALERLQARGHFEDGVFVDVDPVTGERHERDSVQALYEEQYEAHTGQKFVVPAEGYDSPILMHPEAFAYYVQAPGVELRPLGNFHDHPGPRGDVRLSMMRLSDGGRYRFLADRAQMAWTKTGGLIIGGKAHPALTFVYSPIGEEVEVTGDAGVEVNLVEFPRLD